MLLLYFDLHWKHILSPAIRRLNPLSVMPLFDSERQYVFSPDSLSGALARKIFEQIDAAVTYYETVRPCGPNGMTFAQIRDLGYVDEISGERLPTWLELIGEHHPELLQPAAEA
jgi:hypothetical protein